MQMRPSEAPPAVHRDAVFAVTETKDLYYAAGVVCNPKATLAARAAGQLRGEDPIHAVDRSAFIPPTPACPRPTIVNLTLDLYTPEGGLAAAGPRPAFVAIHSGGYSQNGKDGYKNEMATACRHFAARGYVAITMDYRLTNTVTGGALGPANWSATSSPLKPPAWQGGFNPAPRTVYPAVRDSKAAIRWLRANAERLGVNPAYVGAGGWSAGACTTVHLATSFEWDFTMEMSAATDPTFETIHADVGVSSLIQVGCYFAPFFAPLFVE